ncbi:thiaminase II [Pseudonocardia thermophila]|uniref:thiaminase II n=1 Tax=Pseudonocardia thermophila TaxID=1848 RepID=UPI00248E0C2F|nr:thiaminase II [Pseudonocardia thermophila]
MRTRDLLWSDVEHIHAAILAHPFVTGLTDATLPRPAFRYYVVQDAHYLRGYAKALAACAAKAPDAAATSMFAEHAAGAIAAERDLHASLMADLGSSVEEAAAEPVTPATQAYVSYLLATVHDGSYAEAVAAVLPCYWIYAKVGAALLEAGSPDPLYQRWIEMYGGDAYQAVVDAVLDETDRIGAAAGATELERMRTHFTVTSRYEWMFWDAAWRQETWPI